jgi:hypothetical protein
MNKNTVTVGEVGAIREEGGSVIVEAELGNGGTVRTVWCGDTAPCLLDEIQVEFIANSERVESRPYRSFRPLYG